MSKILDRTGTGAALTAAQNDSNLSSLSGINEAQTGTTYTVTIDDQNRTIEFSNAGAVTVTMTAIATIAAALHTDDFKVTLLNIGAGTVTVNTADTFLGGGTSIVISKGESVTLQTDSTLTIWNILYPGRTVPITVAGTGLSTTMEITSGLGGVEYEVTARIDSDNASGGVYKFEFNGDTTVTNYWNSVVNGMAENDNGPSLTVGNATQFVIIKGKLFVEAQSQDIHFFGDRYYSVDNTYQYFHIVLLGSNTTVTSFSIKETTTTGKFKTSAYIKMIRVN